MNPDAVYSKLTETGYVKLSKPKFQKPCIIPAEKKKIWVEFPAIFSTRKIKTRKLKMVYIRDTTINDLGKILSFAQDNKNKYGSRRKFHDLLQAHFKQKKGAEALSLSTLHNPQNWDITFIHLGLLDGRMKITADGTELAHYCKKTDQNLEVGLHGWCWSGETLSNSCGYWIKFKNQLILKDRPNSKTHW